MTPARTENMGHPVDALSDEANAAHAAPCRHQPTPLPSVSGAAHYPHRVADVIGVDCVDLADLIVRASERRASTGGSGALPEGVGGGASPGLSRDGARTHEESSPEAGTKPLRLSLVIAMAQVSDPETPPVTHTSTEADRARFHRNPWSRFAGTLGTSPPVW